MEVNEVFERVKGLFVEELGIDSEKITTVSYTHLTLPTNREV